MYTESLHSGWVYDNQGISNDCQVYTVRQNQVNMTMQLFVVLMQSR